MIIAVDGYEANVRERVGIGRYAFESLRHIHELFIHSSQLTSGNSVRVYLPSRPLSDMPKETSWWQYKIAHPAKLWTFVGLPLALTLDRPQADVVFSPTHYIPRFTSIPKVMPIMDT